MGAEWCKDVIKCLVEHPAEPLKSREPEETLVTVAKSAGLLGVELLISELRANH